MLKIISEVANCKFVKDCKSLETSIKKIGWCCFGIIKAKIETKSYGKAFDKGIQHTWKIGLEI